MQSEQATYVRGFKPMWLGILASLFFAVTFVFNEAMSLRGGPWFWSAALRYFFMLPFLVVIVWLRGGLPELSKSIRQNWLQWLVWGTIGFGLFYAPLCFSADYGPAWLVAGSWQITIVCGVLLTPWLSPRNTAGMRTRVPRRELVTSVILLLGVVLMEAAQSTHVRVGGFFAGFLPVVLAAIAYPLGNRKTMLLFSSSLDTYQRLLGMTIGSVPFWLILCVTGVPFAGWPSTSQILGSLVVAVSSGVIATALFFAATDMAMGSPRWLAIVEATQSGEVVFALVGQMLLLPGAAPTPVGYVGVAVVIAGLCVHSWQMGRAKYHMGASAPLVELDDGQESPNS
ncbi:membrane protein [Alicyclobacillus hesperidum]|uniref:Membrane protein n=1 Tax=Alicyclobacillus hesperidum TaxID=89784 RepID=A0AA37U1N6_9BACL|nr:multidrug resistance efflux transporter family protein [Alicyclobacillus hesperidum]GLV14013.1 membrane protein [Alicyclobacillus hesperidum]